MAIQPIFISVQEAADALNVTRWQMYRLAKDGLVTSKVLGRRRLVSVESLREYAESLPTDREAS